MSDNEDIIITVPALLTNPEEYARVRALPRLGEPGAHACPVEGCVISSEEHHRIAYGYMTELKNLRRKTKELTK